MKKQIALLGFLIFVTSSAVSAQGILPADGPEPPSGANPFQGLGRGDDPGPNRTLPAAGTAAPEQPAAAGSAAGAKPADQPIGGTKPEKTLEQQVEEDRTKAAEEDARNRAEEEKKRAEEFEALSRKAGQGASAATVYDPLKEALFDLHSKEYEKCFNTLNKILLENPNNPSARYVRGVAYVLTRQYAKAADDYRQVLRLLPGSELANRASEGLKKINF